MSDSVDPPKRAPDCLVCLNYRVSWDAALPRACAVFGIKSRTLPSYEVFRATGTHCPSFVRRAAPSDRAPGDPGSDEPPGGGILA